MDADAAARRRRMTVRKFASHAEADAADVAYWRDVSPEDRLEAVWDMVRTYAEMQGQSGDQLRLQRTVCRVDAAGVDILSSIDGVTFADAWAEKASMSFGGVPITVLGRRHLIQNKRAVGRLQDLADVERLEQLD